MASPKSWNDWGFVTAHKWIQHLVQCNLDNKGNGKILVCHDELWANTWGPFPVKGCYIWCLSGCWCNVWTLWTILHCKHSLRGTREAASQTLETDTGGLIHTETKACKVWVTTESQPLSLLFIPMHCQRMMAKIWAWVVMWWWPCFQRVKTTILQSLGVEELEQKRGKYDALNCTPSIQHLSSYFS